MKDTIRQVLDDMKYSQINIGSSAARETISTLITAALKTKGHYRPYPKTEIEQREARETWVCSICDENTYEVEWDYIGSGTNHLGCELKETYKYDGDGKPLDTNLSNLYDYDQNGMTGHDHGKVWPGLDKIISDDSDLQKQIYTEMTADGLPPGGDTQAVIDSHRLAEEIVNAQEGSWIFESPDGGKTIFRRPFSDYSPENKEEIDWETKEPTGRVFSDYNNGHWEKGNEG